MTKARGLEAEVIRLAPLYVAAWRTADATRTDSAFQVAIGRCDTIRDAFFAAVDGMGTVRRAPAGEPAP